MEFGLIGVAIAIPCLLLALADRKKIIAAKREEFVEETRNLILTQESGRMTEPIMCPLCHKPVSEYEDNGSWVIECPNPNCLLIVGPLEEKNRLRKMMEAEE